MRFTTNVFLSCKFTIFQKNNKSLPYLICLYVQGRADVDSPA